MHAWSRRRVEPILLALLAISTVMPLRLYVEWPVGLSAEILSIISFALMAEFFRTRRQRWRHGRLIETASISCLVIASPISAILCRFYSSPIAYEISALTTIGAISLAIALCADRKRTRSYSLVSGGFLVLFTAAISEYSNVIFLPMIWMLGCLWHLIANRWESLDLAMPVQVERNRKLTPVSLFWLFALISVVIYSVRDHLPGSNRFTRGWMPTSGGSQWSDPAARDGVGTGDAAVAARDRAESFGAVDSDMLLESTESSLFDMANEMIGDPITTKVWESRQAIGNENFIPMHEDASRSEKGGGSFSVDRMPPAEHFHLSDEVDKSVVQWDGPTGIRLAMHRYDQFDGHRWTKTQVPQLANIQDVQIDNEHWWFDSTIRSWFRKVPESVDVGLVKIINLDSQRFPLPMMTAAVHIKQIDRKDFFGIAPDGCFFMPRRKRIPPLTVVHAASLSISEDDLRERLKSNQALISNSQSYPTLALKDQWCASDRSPLQNLRRVVANLRAEFKLSRDGSGAAKTLEEFLDTKRGGDHLFATSAALLARQLGFQSRLVTGFYVRPESYDVTAGHSSVMRRDFHVWTEVRLEDGRWFEIEPTPTYVQPYFGRSLWLRFTDALQLCAPFLAWGCVAIVALYITRVQWINWLLNALWATSVWRNDRARLKLAMQVIECRASLAGCKRLAGDSQRVWLERLSRVRPNLQEATDAFLDAADLVFFSDRGAVLPAKATDLVDLLSLRTFTDITKDPST